MSTLQVGSYSHIIKPENVESVNTMVDAALSDLVAIEKEVGEAYGNRAELVKAAKQLEGEIKLLEAGAFMKIGVDNTVEIDGSKVKLANSEMRDMYRRYVSREPRSQLTGIEADLAQVECQIALMKDRWDILKQSTNLIEARAWAQGNLLKFLSSKG
ncbi:MULTISPECIES: hypothetical protein [unclassified Exiguobacterium]|uniref:hypothetical protein n=1 Tax=unclassified Exiguobacterium TaxID=2644629 RepID=UPI001BE50637|nr:MULTISPECIES: hypothetical protein [unclassified Exiguobacterium]